MVKLGETVFKAALNFDTGEICQQNYLVQLSEFLQAICSRYWVSYAKNNVNDNQLLIGHIDGDVLELYVNDKQTAKAEIPGDLNDATKSRQR